MKNTLLFFVLLNLGCTNGSSGGGGSAATPPSPVTPVIAPIVMSIDAVSMDSGGFLISGSNLDSATTASIDSKSMEISEQTATALRLRPSTKMSLLAGVAFTLLMQNAYGDTSSTITIGAAPMSCPSGWAKVTAGGAKSYDFCIEKTPSAADTFTNGQASCLSRGGSLCFTNELMAACGVASAQGIVSMAAASEWSQNYDSMAGQSPITLNTGSFSSGSQGGIIAAGCLSTSTQAISTPSAFRCCRR